MKFLAILLIAFSSSVSTVPQLTSDIQSKAKTEKKYIVVYFGGSDWCQVCHRYKKETLNVPQIDSTLKADFIFYEADFPQRIKQEKTTIEANEFLAEKLNPGGTFPMLVVVDADLNIKQTFKRGMDNATFLEALKKWKEECSK